jgi:uncharacterized protein (DUF362 family)
MMTAATTLALYHSATRAETVRQAAEAVLDALDWQTRQSVLIKPNLVCTGHPLAITHRDALTAVLESVRKRYAGPLTIAEGSAVEPTHELFRMEGYTELAARYQAHLLDLNTAPGISATIYDQKAQPLRVRLARAIVESDCRISLAPPKTHDYVIVTLSLKNMIMSSLARKYTKPSLILRALNRVRRALGLSAWCWDNDKWAVHQGFHMMNVNLAVLARHVWPHISVIDGFVGMEGDGPVNGTPVPWGIVLAGTDPLAVDALAAHLMGYSIGEVGCLSYCHEMGLGQADWQQINVRGNITPEEARRQFAPPPSYAQQRQWQHPQAARLVHALAHDHTQETAFL